MLKNFEDYLLEDGKAANTIRSYILNVGLYLKWYEETFGTEMTELLHGNVLDYRSYLQNVKKQKAVSVNAKLSALISLNAFLVASGRQTEIVVSKADLLRIQAAYTSPSDLTEKAVDAFRQTVLLESGTRNHALVTILAYAGLRVSEACSLSTEDVDLVGRQITVNKGKGNKERVVFIGDKVINAVREYLADMTRDSRWLFPGRGDNGLDRSSVNRLCNDYSDKITPHKLRHFFCSNALEKGYSFHEVAHQAGHSNIHTTLRYTNPTSEAMKEKANKL
ncbi:MAG: tyrosine-type recombinase/integrase [Oscillospiraceae bacterium]|jgi:site-specific recombinase XerD|nr:tyrosine-type recombinase/integrase [Oscillospiraceae bacterium]